MDDQHRNRQWCERQAGNPSHPLTGSEIAAKFIGLDNRLGTRR